MLGTIFQCKPMFVVFTFHIILGLHDNDSSLELVKQITKDKSASTVDDLYET